MLTEAAPTVPPALADAASDKRARRRKTEDEDVDGDVIGLGPGTELAMGWCTVYSRNPYNPYPSGDTLSYGLWEVMGLEGLGALLAP